MGKRLTISEKSHRFLLLSAENAVFGDGRLLYDFKRQEIIWGALRAVRPAAFGRDGYASAKGYSHIIRLDSEDSRFINSYAYALDVGFGKLYKIGEISDDDETLSLYANIDRIIGVSESEPQTAELCDMERR